ncbi:MAG: hypothetical protein ACYC8S_01010 [Minisyncoccota bacterium]
MGTYGIKIVAGVVMVGVFSLALHERIVFAQNAQDVSVRQVQLQQQLDQIEREINDQKTILSQKQKQSASLERDIAILDAKITQAQLSIRARDISLEQLSTGIAGKSQTIGKLSDKLDRERASLSQLLRKTNDLDAYSLPEVILSGMSVSEFFSDLDSFSVVNQSIHDSIQLVQGVKKDTETEKAALEEKKSEESSLRQIQVLERQRLTQDKITRNQLLATTKGQEKTYQAVIRQKEKSAAQIRTALFTLQGSAAIPFGKALDYANIVSKQTGIRPAFLLGIIAEESNLGENVGTGSWRVDMHPTRDQPIFLKITTALGLDPDKMPVSKKPWYGYGGAMGPAQFIPSTWVMYQDKVGSLTGHTPPNPWDPKDAFMAAGLYLEDSGGAGGNASDERYAALCYLAGCRNAKKSAYAFYGDDVMSLAEKYQQQIDILQRGS